MTSDEFETQRSKEIRHRAQLPRLVEATFYLVVAVSFAIGFIWYNEGPPMVVVERHLLTPEVKLGNKITIYNIVVATKECPVEVFRSITDSTGVIYYLEPEVLWPDKQIGRIDYTSEVTVPLSAATGMATYKVQAEWECNPLQRLFPPKIAFSSIEVEIVE